MDARTVRLAVALFVVVLLMVAPMVLLSSDRGGSDARDALAAVGASLAGNQEADQAAAEAYPTLTRREVDGREVFTRADETGCWLLDVSVSPDPSRVEDSLCA